MHSTVRNQAWSPNLLFLRHRIWLYYFFTARFFHILPHKLCFVSKLSKNKKTQKLFASILKIRWKNVILEHKNLYILDTHISLEQVHFSAHYLRFFRRSLIFLTCITFFTCSIVSSVTNTTLDTCQCMIWRQVLVLCSIKAHFKSKLLFFKKK